MKILIVKDVYSSAGWRREGDIVELDTKTANHYLTKGIKDYEYKEEKSKKKETKEAKTPKRRTTKKLSNARTKNNCHNGQQKL